MALYYCYYHRITTKCMFCMYHMNLRKEITDSGVGVGLGVSGIIPNSQCKTISTQKLVYPLPPIRIKTESLLKNPYPKETVGKNGLFGEGHVSRERGSRFDSPKTCRRSPLVSTKYVQTSLTCKRYRFFAISQNTLYLIFFLFSK